MAEYPRVDLTNLRRLSGNGRFLREPEAKGSTRVVLAFVQGQRGSRDVQGHRTDIVEQSNASLFPIL